MPPILNPWPEQTSSMLMRQVGGHRREILRGELDDLSDVTAPFQ
jgi:hypothetical protein